MSRVPEGVGTVHQVNAAIQIVDCRTAQVGLTGSVFGEELSDMIMKHRVGWLKLGTLLKPGKRLFWIAYQAHSCFADVMVGISDKE